MSTRAGSGFDSPESGMGPGPEREIVQKRNPSPQSPTAQPSDGSPSKCLEQGYGKPVKSARRSFLNFCKQMTRIKELPSNCQPCPTPEPEESFWDYLFKFDEKKGPETSEKCVSHQRRDLCEMKRDPPFCNPDCKPPTQGEVFSSSEPQPRPPPLYPLPKAVAYRRLAESKSFRVTREAEESDPRCSGPRPFRIPFEECRPPRRTRKPFSCSNGVSGADVAPPVSTNRGTCGGRSVGEFLAEATIARSSPSSELPRNLDARYGSSRKTVKTSSRVERLRQLTRAAGC